MVFKISTVSVSWDILDDTVLSGISLSISISIVLGAFSLLVLSSVKYQKTVMIKTGILTLTHAGKFKKKFYGCFLIIYYI